MALDRRGGGRNRRPRRADHRLLRRRRQRRRRGLAARGVSPARPADHYRWMEHAEEETFRLTRLRELLEHEARALGELGDRRLLPVLVEIDELSRELARTRDQLEQQAETGSRRQGGAT